MEKGLKPLLAVGRRRPHVANPSDDLEDDGIIPDSRYASSRVSKSNHDEDENSFNDSGIGIGHDVSDLPFPPLQTTHPPNRHNNDAPYSSGGRSYSTASSTGFTPKNPAAPTFGSPMMTQNQGLPSPFAQAQSQSPGQTSLPSFSSAFGIPSISSVIHSHEPGRGAAVTTHC